MQKNQKNASPRLAAAVAAALGVGTTSPPVVAQQAYTDEGTPLETIIVTATRRDVNVQDVPFNMAALGPDLIDDLRITNLAELTRAVPGLYVPSQGPRGANLVTVRGLNVTSLNDSTGVGNSTGGTVATYLGDIPLYVDLKMIDVERVEALLGPQGTLYGAGTLAGAIRYLPNRPDPTAFAADVGGRFYALGESDGLGSNVWGMVNVPLVADRLALRVAAGYLDDPGFIDYDYVVREPGVSNPNAPFDGSGDDVSANLRKVEDVDSEETFTGRVGLYWLLTDALEANLTYYYQDQQVGGRTIDHDAALGTGRHVSGSRFLEPNDKTNHLFALELAWDLGFAELTSATGSSKFDSFGKRDQTDFLMDLDFQPQYEDFPQFAAYATDDLEEETFNQELRLVSQGTQKWSWIVGAFYNRYEGDAIASEYTPGIPEWYGYPEGFPDLEYRATSDRTFEEKAVFGELGYRLTDRWQVTVGARWFDYDDELSLETQFPLVPAVLFDENETGDDDTIFKFNTSYEITPDVMSYLTVSEGYRQGGLNSGPPCPEPIPDEQSFCLKPDEVLIKPDTTTNYEIGLRSLWLDGRLLVNAAVYYIDWNDIQVLGTSDVGEVPITVNGGSAETRGVELSSRWSITDGLEVAVNMSFNDAQLTSDAPGLVDGADAFDGDRLAGTPEEQGTLLLDYARPLDNGWTLNANYSLTAVSDVYTKVGLRNNGEVLPGYAIHAASVGVSSGPWSVTLFADNLFDKYAVTSVRRDPSYIRMIERLDWSTPDPDDQLASIPSRTYFQSMLRPRTVGLEFSYRFDL
ncbi:MAG TPA: TonB-dependent receptor [Steroidobacteraceae bacterium]|nr:TonB-dependent receptor [Steroidobacteraceae bacterium]